MTRHAPTFFFVQLLSCITAVQSFSLKNCTIGYSENVVEVLCQNYALKEIPDDIPQNTNQLDLSFNKISEIKITDLGYLPELVSLLVNDNQLYHIDDYAFAELKELKFLRLSHNKLISLTDHMFEGLDKLASLYLDHNNISQVSPHAFQPLAGLHNVKLDWNHIDNIRDIATLFQLPNVELISLTQNHITSFDSDDLPFNTSNVKSLVFQSNKLQKFSLKRDIFPYLRSIDLYNSAWFTEWDVVNKTFLRSVTEISLGGRFISLDAYTDMLHSTSSLQKLDLAAMNRNKLNISIDIACSIPSLRTLELTFNVLYVIDDNLLKLCSHLTELTLSLNNLKELSDQSLKSLTQIRLLALNKNDLPKVPLAIRGLSTLEILDLSVNFISEIDCLDFVNLTKLTTLDLRKNRIANLQECIFQKLHNLNSLDISKNMVHSLDYVFRVNMSKLKTLILSENSDHLLLKQGEFMTLSSLRVLELHSGTYYLSQNGAFEGLNHLKILILSINGYSNKLFEGLTQLENLQLHLRFIRNMRDNQNVNENNEDPPFSGLPNLKILSLKVYDQFTVVPSPDLLSGLKSLQSLSADNFFQNSIHQDTFKYTPQLLKLRIINSNLLVLPPELFQPLHNLQQLDLSNNKFQSLDFLANLKVLHWPKDKKQLPVKNDTISQTLPALIHQETLNYTLHLLSLPVINRDLSVLPPELFQSIQNLRQLDLSNNSFQSLDFLANLKALQWVKATKNQLSVINETTFQTLPALTYLDVTNNPLSCECSNIGFKQWTLTNNQTQVINGHQYKCAFPVSQQKNRFLDFDTRSCWIDSGFICFTSSSCLILLTLFVSFAYNFLRWQLAYAYYLFLAYVYDTKNRKKGTGHLYDAFISYNVHDEDWVYTEMLPVLEGEQGWRLCLHHRDFEPGKPIVENITDAIYGSRKTICVISRHYLQSEWCSREIQMASVRLFEEQKDVLILVFLEDIPTWQLSPYYQMRRLVKKRTYLSWPQAAQHKGVFWQKINQALKTGNNPNDNKHLIIEQDDV